MVIDSIYKYKKHKNVLLKKDYKIFKKLLLVKLKQILTFFDLFLLLAITTDASS